MACPVTKTLSVAFTPSPSATSYRIKWRVVGSSTWITPVGVFTTSPIAIANVPVCETVEGTVEAVCGATFSTVATFQASPETMYTCNDAVSGTSSSTVYMRYPKKTYDLQNSGDLITVTYDVSGVPNRINAYNSASTLVATSGWKGVANYAGPWGTSLSTANSGNFTFLKSTAGGDGRYYYLEVEHAGSQTSDSWSASMTCTIVSNGGNGSGTPGYTVVPNTLTVSEGGNVTWTVTTTNVVNGTTLYYSLTGLANAADFTDSTLTGSFIVSNNTGTFSKTLRNDITTEGSETIIAAVKTGSVSGTTVATAAQVLVLDTSTASNSNDPTYTITPSSAQVIEGNNITFNIITTNFTGTTLYYTLESTGGSMSAADFSDNSASGSVTITNNAGSFTKTLADDGLSETGNTFKAVLRAGSTGGTILAQSSSVTVLDASQAVNPATYAVVPSVTSVNEGSPVTWTVTTTDVDDGTVLYYTIDGQVNNDDMTTITNGQFTINGNTGSFSKTFVNDLTTEGAETVIAKVRTGSVSGTIKATSATVTLNDTSTTPQVVTYYSVSRCDDNHSDILRYNGGNDLAVGAVVKSDDDFCYTIVSTTSNPGFAPSGGTYVSTFADCNACTGYTPPAATYSVTKNSSSINEGGSVTITVNTTNVADGTVLYHTLHTGSNVVDIDFTDDTTAGSFTINNNTGSFTRTMKTDTTTEGNETFSVDIRTVSVSGTIVGNSGTITVVDTSTTPVQVTYYNVTACAGGSGVLRYNGGNDLTAGLVVVSDNGNCYTIGTTTSGPAYSSGIYAYEVSDCNDGACS